MVVEDAVDQYRDRSKLFGQYEAGLILLDTDRIEEDRARGRDPLAAASGERLRLVHLRPKLEGLLFRLYPGNERRFVPARSAERFLRGRWPTYDKPESADALGQRFTPGDLRRASQHDADLHWVLEILGLSHTQQEGS